MAIRAMEKMYDADPISDSVADGFEDLSDYSDEDLGRSARLNLQVWIRLEVAIQMLSEAVNRHGPGIGQLGAEIKELRIVLEDFELPSTSCRPGL
ncbi:hypothetical protein B0I35DRAFT_426729 [Stachybotrys elegans]|uniref:Uncharacterized protein n=1 Tax=Stachybotrys elegans TaxID=80388 RepID=A0A8K0SVU0_9HYPO|nr:hypothetical protein B0I35DRAFT_426729 [Stachybotrys elegans]